MTRSLAARRSLCLAAVLAAALAGCSSGTSTAGSSAASSAPAALTSSPSAVSSPAASSPVAASTAASTAMSTSTAASSTAASSTALSTSTGMSMSSATTASSSTAPASSPAAANGTAAGTAAACKDLVKVDALPVPESDSDAPPPAAAEKAFGKALQPLLADASAKGDARLRSILRTLATPVSDAVTKGKPLDPSSDKALATSLAGYEKWAQDSCGFQKIDLMAIDYKYKNAPTTVKAGVVSTLLMNDSKKGEFHVALFVQPKSGKRTTLAALLKTPVQQLESSVNIIGGADAGPGQSGGILLTLKPGQYFVVCPVAVGGKQNSTDLHMFHGMAFELDVT